MTCELYKNEIAADVLSIELMIKFSVENLDNFGVVTSTVEKLLPFNINVKETQDPFEQFKKVNNDDFAEMKAELQALINKGVNEEYLQFILDSSQFYGLEFPTGG